MANTILAPQRSYLFELKIKGIDYTPDIYQVRVTTSIAAPWPVVVLNIFVDVNDVILEGLWGQDPCELNIILLGQTGLQSDQIKLDLMVVDMNLDIQTKDQMSEGKQKDRTPITITTVARDAFKTMTTMVNDVFENMSLKDIISSLVSTAGGTLIYDAKNENTEKISQVVVPPTTLYRVIQYLDSTFGLFEGVPVAFCDLENNVHIYNLSERMNKSQTFTITQLASGMNTTDIVENTSSGKEFYTYSVVKTRYRGNATYAVLASNMAFIAKPKDSLYYPVDLTLDGICKDNGLISRNSKIPTDTNIAHRKTYYINQTGYNYTEAFARSIMAKRISSLSEVNISIEKNLPVWNLLQVGEPVKFIPRTVEFINLSGKYILKASDLYFKKNKDWESTANIYLIRTNRTI